MSAPLVSATYGLVRSVNPLASKQDVSSVLEQSTSQGSYSILLGYGVPRSDLAVKSALGESNGVQVLNRAMPLFALTSSEGEDRAHTTKPQVAMAMAFNSTWKYVSDSSSPVVSGFAFSESPDNPNPNGQGEWPPTPRADVYLLSTHNPVFSDASVEPIFRVRKGVQAYNPDNSDWTLVRESELSGFKTGGFEIDGIEGYVFSSCGTECQSAGLVELLRAFNAIDSDYAVFPSTKLSMMQSLGFTGSVTSLGFVFPNTDSDGDGLIDGMEALIGTDSSLVDSDCDGSSDGFEFPLTRSYRSDPMLPYSCSGGGGPGGGGSYGGG